MWLNIICVDMVIPIFGCAVRFNPWYVDFISGPSSCDNQPWFKWLIVKLCQSFRQRLVLLKTFRLWPTVFCWAVLFYGQAFSFLVILCRLCSWRNIHGEHGWHRILKYNYALHVQLLFILQSLEYASVRALQRIIFQTKQSYERWPSAALSVLTNLGSPWTKQESSKIWQAIFCD
jgi:hypothetical protein